MDTRQLIARIERVWDDFRGSYAGLSDGQMTGPLVTSAWTAKDVVAHVTWWEEEALKYLPEVAAGMRPKRYAEMYGGLDAFNALMTERWRTASLPEVLAHAEAVHGELLRYLESVSEDLIRTDTRFRRRLRMDTYGHYPLHAEVLRAWREAQGI